MAAAVGRAVFHAQTDALVASDVVRLDGPEGRHAATVLRVRVGELVSLTDGAGLLVEGTVASVAKDVCDVHVVRREQLPAPTPRLVVVQALAKGDRGEVAVETMTEVGVDVVVPWQAARSVAVWSRDRAEKGLRRWRSTAHAAAKQSRRVWWPEVRDVVTTDGVVSLISGAAASVVLHEGASRPIADVDVPTSGDVVVVVGPEGGLTDDEVATFEAARAVTCRLGPTVLRTSTAGTVAAAALFSHSARWSKSSSSDGLES